MPSKQEGFAVKVPAADIEQPSLKKPRMEGDAGGSGAKSQSQPQISQPDGSNQGGTSKQKVSEIQKHSSGQSSTPPKMQNVSKSKLMTDAMKIPKNIGMNLETPEMDDVCVGGLDWSPSDDESDSFGHDRVQVGISKCIFSLPKEMELPGRDLVTMSSMEENQGLVNKVPEDGHGKKIIYDKEVISEENNLPEGVHEDQVMPVSRQSERIQEQVVFKIQEMQLAINRKRTLEGTNLDSNNSFAALDNSDIIEIAADMDIMISDNDYAKVDIMKNMEIARYTLKMKSDNNNLSNSDGMETNNAEDLLVVNSEVPLLEWLNEDS